MQQSISLDSYNHNSMSVFAESHIRDDGVTNGKGKGIGSSRFPLDEETNKSIKKIIDDEIKKEIGHETLMDMKKQMGCDLDDRNKVLSHLGEYIEEPYKIIESYFANQYLDRLVRHQIESYNHFISFQIQRTIQMFNPVTIHSENDFVAEHNQYFLEIQLSFENFKLYPPQIHENNGATKLMLPQEARLRNFTYASTMTVDLHIQYIVRNTEKMDTPKIIKKVLPKINIGKMPIMIKSAICVLTQNKHIDTTLTGECSMDCGGYFIVKGSEKTVLGQERAAENRVYCFDGKNTTKWNWFAEIKSVPDFKCISPKQIEMMIASKNNGFGNGMFINIPRIKQPIELFVLFRALGVLSDKEICQHILLDIHDDKYKILLEFLQASIIDANKYLTQEDALRHITSVAAYTPLNMDKETGYRKKREFTLDVLNNDLFPHCKTQAQKLYFIGYMANKLIQTSLGMLPPDDRDSYLNKRIELTGTLLNNLFRNYFNKLVKEMQKQVIREINNGSWRSMEDYENIINMTNIYKIMKSTTIENGITRALSTGDFSIKQSNSSKVGVAQVLNRLTYLAGLSHLRRINTPLEKSGELIAPRKLHNTTWGFLCLAGDTDVLLSNRNDTKKIVDIRNGDWVTTVNRETLVDEASDVYNFFGKMPDKLYEITTISGRKIKATADHPFLIKTESGKYEMVAVRDLKENDKVIIRHTVKPIPDENTSTFQIDETTVLEHYRIELLESGFLNTPLSISKLKIIARLIGALNTEGMIGTIEGDKREEYILEFNVSEEDDVYQAVDDIKSLGFYDDCVIKKNTTTTYTLRKVGSFAYLMHLMGASGKFTNKPNIPEWLINAELSIKREFLSAFQSNKGGVLKYNSDDNYSLESKRVTTHNGYMKNTTEYVCQIIKMFNDLNIKCSFEIERHVLNEKYSFLVIIFDNSKENLIKYIDTINHTYCNKNRIDSALLIEKLKVEHYSALEQKNINEINYEGVNDAQNNCVSVPILSIKEIAPEMVYDFTTRSDNHSFVASSFVCSNCAVESPEGQSIGVVKNISYMCHITIPTNSSSLYDYVKPYVRYLEDCSAEELNKKVKVFVNGAWLGISENPVELYNSMKEKKYAGIINIYTSIIFDYKLMEIRICTDGGRLTRPLLKVKNNHALITEEIINKLSRKEITWNDLLTNTVLDESVIEYIDPDEQNNAMIAMKVKEGYLQNSTFKFNFTHCEIHPSTIFGIIASCVPFPEHNQAPRNTYQSAMQKQAIGVYATNYDQRMDKTSYIMANPSRPLVETRLMNFIHINKIPSGCQIHVAIMTHTGYNQEDSVLVNKGSIDRGLFSATIYHTEKDEDKNIVRDEIIRCKPDKTKTKGIKFGNYDKLNAQGFIPENTQVENRDVIIAKIIPIKENKNDPTKTIKYEDQSKTFRTTEETYIDKNYTGRNGDGYNFAKVRVRIFRKPVYGDKFSSRMGQKGTCGNIIPECDMPFTKEGLRPDIIINPHAIPSRMTIGQLKETLLGKVLVELGLYGDGTSFNDLSVHTIAQELQKLGYESYGNEVMYNGLTGEQLETSIFIGPVYYQRLKHMVNDKQHSRSIGPMVNLTRQPAEGRSRDGGFRIGEMERDVMLAHGMSGFCRERMFDVSDKYNVYVCKMCGMIASYNNGDGNRFYSKSDFTVHHCNTCGNKSNFANVDIPYAYKLLSQELQTINVVPRIITE